MQQKVLRDAFTRPPWIGTIANSLKLKKLLTFRKQNSNHVAYFKEQLTILALNMQQYNNEATVKSLRLLQVRKERCNC